MPCLMTQLPASSLIRRMPAQTHAQFFFTIELLRVATRNGALDSRQSIKVDAEVPRAISYDQ